MIATYTDHLTRKNMFCRIRCQLHCSVQGGSQDSLPLMNDEDTSTSCKIKLMDNFGVMHKRTREAIIRFHQPNKEKNPTDFFRTKLMLYLPWRNENADLLVGYMDYISHYQNCQEIITENEAKYTANLEDLTDYLQLLQGFGPPQHVWLILAPTAEENRMQEEADGHEQLTNLDQEDLDANSTMDQQSSGSFVAELHARYEGEAMRDKIPPEEYRTMMRQLNRKQLQIVRFHRNWCKEALVAMRDGHPIVPYRVFLSGPGGVGKSHVIKIIQSDTIKLLRLSGRIEPGQVTVLLTAPTGVAAFNIGGMTLHSALLLGCNKFHGYKALTTDTLNTLKSRLGSLQLLIIDEVSMVGSNMLLEIHRRLQEIKGAPPDTTFGGISILAVGDLYQLPPVCQPPLFDMVSDAYARLHKAGSLWRDEFIMLELDEIMRQRSDKTFAELLCRVRMSECVESDIALLKSREIQQGVASTENILHVYKKNVDVDVRNTYMLDRLAVIRSSLKLKMTLEDRPDRPPSQACPRT